MQFCWKIGNVEYALMQVHQSEIVKARLDNPYETGIPRMYAIIKGEPEWFPYTFEGFPQVHLFSPL